jgi:hypothetical protein
MIFLVMAAGVLLRSRFVSASPFPNKYDGDALWALLEFFGFEACRLRQGRSRT